MDIKSMDKASDLLKDIGVSKFIASILQSSLEEDAIGDVVCFARGGDAT
jgi:hypothetical protein